MVKELKKRIAQLQKRMEALTGYALSTSAARVRQLRRELDKLARRLDSMARRRTA
jgi:hypothetical protein